MSDETIDLRGWGEDREPEMPSLDPESQLLDLLTEWIQRHHRDGGDFSAKAIACAGDVGRDALRSGYPLEEAFEAGRSAYFASLGHVERSELSS